jgi:hypothetical protein
MSDLDTRLRAALHDLAPEDPTTEGLADGARRYATRTRLVRQLGVGAMTAATIILGAVLVGSFDPPARVVPARPVLTPADCTRQATQTSVPTTDGVSTADVVAAWVCPDANSGSEATGASADGWRLPTDAITGPHLVTLNVVGRRADTCGTARPGPAFTVTLESVSGQLTTFRSSAMACDGAYALASFLGALADEEADVRAQSATRPELACRSDEAWLRTRKPRDATHELHSPLVAATFCLRPSFLVGDPSRLLQPLTPRAYRSVPLPAGPLAQLNADLTSEWGGFFTGNGACTGEGRWTYSVVGLTSAGDERRLGTGCLDELWVTGVARIGFIPSAQTTAALRALVPPS